MEQHDEELPNVKYSRYKVDPQWSTYILVSVNHSKVIKYTLFASFLSTDSLERAEQASFFFLGPAMETRSGALGHSSELTTSSTEGRAEKPCMEKE